MSERGGQWDIHTRTYTQCLLKLFCCWTSNSTKPPAEPTVEGPHPEFSKRFYGIDHDLPELRKRLNRRSAVGSEPESLSSNIHSARRSQAVNPWYRKGFLVISRRFKPGRSLSCGPCDQSQNPGYSERVYAVKYKVLDLLARQYHRFLTDFDSKPLSFDLHTAQRSQAIHLGRREALLADSRRFKTSSCSPSCGSSGGRATSWISVKALRGWSHTTEAPDTAKSSFDRGIWLKISLLQ